MKKTLGFICTLLFVLNLTACSGAEPSGEAASSENAEVISSEEGAFPVTIQHAYGETTINEEPVTVVTVNDTNADAVLALGVVPAGVSKIGYGVVDEYGLPYWVTDAFQALGAEPKVFDDTDGLDYEAINDCAPDLILSPNSGLTQEEYDRLTEIAPTIPYLEVAYATSWDEQIAVTAKALGMPQKGEQVIADTKQKIADTLAKYPQLQGKKAAFCWISPEDLSTIYIYLPLDPRAGFVEELGLDLPDEIEALAEAGDYSVAVSIENIDILNAVDIIICYGEESMIPELQANEVMNTVPAVANGAIVTISSESDLYSGTYATALSVPAVLDEYCGLLAAAADKAASGVE